MFAFKSIALVILCLTEHHYLSMVDKCNMILSETLLNNRLATPISQLQLVFVSSHSNIILTHSIVD